MEVFEAVRTVLAVRKYQEAPVPPDIVRRIVEAGLLLGVLPAAAAILQPRQQPLVSRIRR